jgi:hypothetical protein
MSIMSKIYKESPFGSIFNSFEVSDEGEHNLELFFNEGGELELCRKAEKAEDGSVYQSVDLHLEFEEVVRLKNFLIFALKPFRENEEDLYSED